MTSASTAARKTFERVSYRSLMLPALQPALAIDATHALTSGWLMEPKGRWPSSGRIQFFRSLVCLLMVPDTRSTLMASHCSTQSLRGSLPLASATNVPSLISVIVRRSHARASLTVGKVLLRVLPFSYRITCLVAARSDLDPLLHGARR